MTEGPTSSTSTGTDRETLRSMVLGLRLAAAVGVAAELGLSDELVGGPRSVAELAVAVGADPDALRRLLRGLASVGVYEAGPDDSYGVTPLGEGLRSDVPGSLRPVARTFQDPAVWAAWGHLGHSVTTGENAFEALHGIDVWTHRRNEPEQSAIFNAHMASVSGLVGGEVTDAYDFSGFPTVVDVGGGRGALLEAVLERHPQLSGIVFDQEHVAADAPSAAASPSVAARWAAATGSFFESVPAADAYLLKSVLHDWPDEQCRTILRTCRRSLNPGGAVLVIEGLLDREGYEAEGAFSDLNMLVLPGGRERAVQEYTALFDDAGLRLTRVVHTTGRMSVLEAR